MREYYKSTADLMFITYYIARFMYIEPEQAKEIGIVFSERDLNQGKIWIE